MGGDLKLAWQAADPFPCAAKPGAWKLAGSNAEKANDNLGVALAYIAQGIPVTPAKPVATGQPYYDVKPDKGLKASIPGVYASSVDEATVRGWWGRYPDALVWVPMGRRTGVFCVDVDIPPAHAFDGAATWARLAAENHDLAKTRIHVTPSGGQHRLYLMPPAKLIKMPKDSGLDLVSEGFGIIAAGSMLPDGSRYRVSWDFDPEPAPEWLIEPPKKGAGGKREGAGRPSKAKKKIHREWTRDAGEAEVKRRIDLIRTTGKITGHAKYIGSIVRAGGADEHWAREQLGLIDRERGGDKAVRNFEWALTSDEAFEAVPPRPGDVLNWEDFVFHGPSNQYIYRPHRKLWSGAAVNKRVLPVQDGVIVEEGVPEEDWEPYLCWRPTGSIAPRPWRICPGLLVKASSSRTS
jgi:Bifunctional DNA primase/polymerase, N-terminal